MNFPRAPDVKVTTPRAERPKHLQGRVVHSVLALLETQLAKARVANAAATLPEAVAMTGGVVVGLEGAIDAVCYVASQVAAKAHL